MEITLEINIDLSRDTVLERYFCWENLALWWKDFISAEHIGGEDGQAGATYRSIATFEGTPSTYTLTILKNELPDAFEQVVQFEHVQLQQTIRHTFQVLEAGATQWKAWHRLSGNDLPHIKDPGFRQMMLDQMTAFKAFAEKPGVN